MSSRTEAFHIPDHTLLRVIGRGSYGEVWLARNIMGTLRAVKIVRRAAFDSDRPYLREFEGIRRCEPVSRAHDGLIDILHMGRHDEEGWFYYVMELADAAHGPNGVSEDHPPDYTPATLAARIGDGKPLEVTECLRIAESLAGALAFLHEQGLIHRDVKPSNVLYVGGVAKLGDIGLVAEAGSSRSYVGTEGFVPLEGPGTERADIFALGKVLYEALTGMDRSKFPRLPADWTQAYDFEQRLELNEIVLRACEGDAVRRYHSAREMLADVAMIASGRSVRKMRGMERRLRALKWTAGSVAAVALAALGVSGLWQQQASRERAGRLTVLYEQVHAARHDPSAGAVTHALRAAAEAAALSPTPQLRDDAIFLLSRSDFVMRPDRRPEWTSPQAVAAIDAESGLYAETPRAFVETPGPATVILHTAGAPDKRRTFVVPGPPPWLAGLELSRGGQRLLMTGYYGSGTVLDTASGAVIASWPPESLHTTLLSFCGDKGDTVIRRGPDGCLTMISLPGGEILSVPVAESWPVRDQRRQLQRLWPSPDGKYVLLIDSELRHPPLDLLLSKLLPMQVMRPLAGTGLVMETATARPMYFLRDVTEPVAAWSGDSTRIALRRAEFIYTVDAASGNNVCTLPFPLHGDGTQMCFLHDRDHLVFSTWADHGLCHLASGEQLCRPPVVGLHSFSPRRQLLAAANGAAEWKPSPVRRTFAQKALNEAAVGFFTFAPDESSLIAGNTEMFTVWPLDSGGVIPAAEYNATGATGVMFPPPGKAAQFLTSAGISEIPWPGALPAMLPEPLPAGVPAEKRCDSYSMSTDGTVRAYGGNRFAVVLRDGAPPRQFVSADPVNMVSVSPDGRWLALGKLLSPTVRIWDLTRSDDAPAHAETCGAPGFPAFSPDGKWLAVSGYADNRILAVDTWQLVRSFPRESFTLTGEISFTKDGRLMSVKPQPRACTIIETGTWRTCFEITSPLDEPLARCALSPGGHYFAATGTRREIHIWDLHALERELKALGLGDNPPL